jgi:hypothetical protein
MPVPSNSPHDGDMLVDRIEAARRLCISPRTLFSRTAPRGPIRCVRVGFRVLYSVREIDRLIAAEMEASTRKTNGGGK